jgi:type I restriction enzyme, S subunit
MSKHLPVDWLSLKIKQVAQVRNGSTPSRSEPRYWENGTYPWLPTGKVNDRVITYADEFITQSALDECSIKIFPAGSILVGMIGQGKTRGSTAYLAIDAAINQNFACVIPSNKINGRYLFYYLENSYGLLRNFSHGSNQGALNCQLIGQFSIVIPPLPEQRKIAEILSTWDEAIAVTERLIAALQQRKRGLMQRLLTGQVRFAGFDGEWKEVQIGKLVKEVKRPIKWDDNALYNLISVRRRSGGLFLREQRKGDEIKTKGMSVAFAGDFLISKMQIVHGASGLTTQEFDGTHISGSYISLVTRGYKILDIRFFDLLSRTPNFYRLTYLSSYGVHIEKMTFNLTDFLKRIIRIPHSIEEQKKIVTIFEAVETEIKLTEKKLEALKQQKKGLMQRLLTGQVRVKG